jgi:hypothetical protein
MKFLKIQHVCTYERYAFKIALGKDLILINARVGSINNILVKEHYIYT